MYTTAAPLSLVTEVGVCWPEGGPGELAAGSLEKESRCCNNAQTTAGLGLSRVQRFTYGDPGPGSWFLGT